jgi:hypothetical protein
MKYLRLEDGRRINIEIITAKDFQITLKKYTNKTEKCDFQAKLDLTKSFDNANINKMRMNCHNSKLRNIYFRLIHNDFFTRVRMKKYKMVDNDECERCTNQETTRHLFYGCEHANNIWQNFNGIMRKIGKNEDLVQKYEDIYEIPKLQAITILKLKMIQEMVQIKRPKTWSEENVTKLIIDLKNMECYNAKINKTKEKFDIKWSIFESIPRQ